jgi:PRTRC genetic system ThiF family protein
MLDFSYAQARPLFPLQSEHLHLVIVGLGGTGSFLARHVACIAAVLRDQGRVVDVTFIDPDKVEEVNIPRQNFCLAEVGLYKALALADRYSAACGVEIGMIPEYFEPDMVKVDRDTLTILLGAVDRASGRVAMGEALKKNRPYLQSRELPRVWYFDSGNGLDFGQFCVGSTDRIEDLAGAFCLSSLGVALAPSPLLQFPALSVPEPEEMAKVSVSCAQRLAANAQSLMINPFMASIAAGYLYDFLITGKLKRFFTRIDLPTGQMESRYTTPEHMAAAIERDASMFDGPVHTS